MPSKKGLRREQGFTLIELLIVMSIIIIIATFAIPNIMRIRRQGNETSAIQSIRTIVQSQLQFSSTYPQNGFACSMSALGGDNATAPSPTAANLIPSDLATGHKAGYSFAIVNCSKVTVNNIDQYTGYEVTAVPDAVGKTGDRGFCSDDAGQIKADPKGGTSCTASIQ